ncbi:glycosyltransferase family 2 protein [Tenacibaculum sp. E3R01]|uniref:glycosyltransferase n=1 Tax=Tenacibaculum sp. E3R01 TaxID=2267227 RepID=UPI000DEA51F3|nr:glycosyltransferase [Tenacibaculum sp. E3R01]RBW63006.1 glycosyltransferase family 2 protein [Tenacibaculum sp. E3R01]
MKSNHTFVIPVYQNSPYLEICINNLKKQSIESNIIITTSTPTKNTRRIADKYNLEYYAYEGDKKGIGNDWNFALSNVRTQYATIAHQDDIYERSFTETVLNKIKHIKKPLLIFTDYYDLVNEKKRKSSLNYKIKKTLLFPFLVKNSHSWFIIKKGILLLGDPICCPSVTLNLKDIENSHKIFSPNYMCALDWIAWLKIARQKGSFIFINKKLIQHRIHDESETTASLNSGVRQKEEYLIFKKIWGPFIAKILGKIYAVGHKDNQI